MSLNLKRYEEMTGVAVVHVAKLMIPITSAFPEAVVISDDLITAPPASRTQASVSASVLESLT